jgi:hypothetical protein
MRRCADQSKYRRSVVTIATYLSVDYPAGVQANFGTLFQASRPRRKIVVTIVHPGQSLERRSGLERFGDGFVLRTFVKQLGCNSAYLFPTIEFFDQLRYEMLDVNHRTS